MKKILFYTICCIVIFTSCTNTEKSTANNTKEEESSHNHEHAEDVIILSEEKAKANNVKASVINYTDFQSVIKVGGKIIPQQSHESILAANSNGIVVIPENLLIGLAVNKGQSLLAISSKEIQDGDPVLKAKVTFDIAKSEYERLKPLVEIGIVTQTDFVTVKQNYENAKIAYQALSKDYTTSGLMATSNLNGFIKEIFIENGEYVVTGQPLLTITNNNKMQLIAEVPSRYFKELKYITSANFKTINLDETYKLSELNGHLISYAKSITNSNSLLPVTFSFEANKQSFVGGSYAEVYLLSRPINNTIVLPYTAITEEEGLFFAYKKVCKEEYEKVEIKLGMDNGSEYQILSGITPGDNIVIEGAQQVKLASATNAIPAHTHDH